MKEKGPMLFESKDKRVNQIAGNPKGIEYGHKWVRDYRGKLYQDPNQPVVITGTSHNRSGGAQPIEVPADKYLEDHPGDAGLVQRLKDGKSS